MLLARNRSHIFAMIPHSKVNILIRRLYAELQHVECHQQAVEEDELDTEEIIVVAFATVTVTS